MKFFTLAFLLITLTNVLNFGQWSSDPAVNLAISDSADRESSAYIISSSDGGSYVSWYNYESGNYNVYMQRLDPLGNKLWGEEGLLISDHHSTVLWVIPVMSLDPEDNVVLAFRDYRTLEEAITYTYKISPNRDFLWGPDGINVYETYYDHINQGITQLNDGSSIISFTVESNPTAIALQKISSDGIKLWGGQPVIIESATENYWYYDIVPTDNNSVIVIHTATNYPIKKLRAIRVNEDGSFGWDTMIQNIGGVLSNYLGRIAVSSDSINGAIIAWTDDRNSVGLHNVYFQRISSNGLIYYPESGIQASIKPSINQIQPLISYDYLNDEIYTSWLETDSTMHRYGITGQKFSANGTRLWGDTGITYKELSDSGTIRIRYLQSQFGGGQNYLFYFIGDYQPNENHYLEGFAVNTNGNFLWTGNFVTLSNTTLEKIGLASTIDQYSNCKLTWYDYRNSEWGVYAQDINPSGQLGNPVIPVELISFTGFNNDGILTLSWTTATETNNAGFEIEKMKTSWQKIGFIPGAGTTTETRSYSFTDEEVSYGIIQYRLKQIDYDGSFEYSNIVEVEEGVPEKFSLMQNYPNPFNPATTIKYQIPERGFVTLKVYDVLGNEVATLVNEEKSAGSYEVEFNLASSIRYPASGIYFYQLKAGNFVENKKMVLLK